ncbi:hypothetical protein OAD12_00845 [Pelagibacterales bacterium]|nr:hypothetical protein [Pelagibacterales bacterium]
MKLIEINTSTPHNYHCLLCGAKNIGETGVENECEHLVYVGTNEGVELDKLSLHNSNNEDKSAYEIIEQLDNNYLVISETSIGLSGLELYIIYKL